MTVKRYIKNEAWQEIDLSAIRSGHILSNIDADDYGFKRVQPTRCITVMASGAFSPTAGSTLTAK